VTRKLLLVSYLFPPAGGITVQRALSFTRYLPALGFEIHVLRAPNAPTPVVDRGLLARVPSEVNIHGAFTPEPPFKVRHLAWSLLSGKGKAPDSPPSAPAGGWRKWAKDAIRRLINPEPEVLWVPFAVRAARRIIRRESIGIVMVTAPPFSAFLVGTRLKREFPHLKFISDFRDEWIDFYLNESDYQSGELVRKRALEIERQTIEASDLVVAVTPSSLARIRNRYPAQPDAKFACVHNGFDPAQFESFRPRPHAGGKVIVTHVGTATKASTPRFYLDALDALPPEIRDSIETRFIGRIADGEKSVFENRQATIRLLGFQPQSEATRLMEETDYLLLTMTDHVSIPGKLFEYLATGKPALAISPPHGEVGRIFAGTRAGWCVDPSDTAGLRNALIEMATRPPAQAAARIDRERVREFERPRQAELLASLISRL
jgi:glycosyltransferase involved in cell wall biosynthesis